MLDQWGSGSLAASADPPAGWDTDMATQVVTQPSARDRAESLRNELLPGEHTIKVDLHEGWYTRCIFSFGFYCALLVARLGFFTPGTCLNMHEDERMKPEIFP